MHLPWHCVAQIGDVTMQTRYSRAMQAVELSAPRDIIVWLLFKQPGCIVRLHVIVNLIEVLCSTFRLPRLGNVLLLVTFVVARLLRLPHDQCQLCNKTNAQTALQIGTVAQQNSDDSCRYWKTGGSIILIVEYPVTQEHVYYIQANVCC